MDTAEPSKNENRADVSQRSDPWYVEWFMMCSALTLFLAYATWATFQGKDFKFGPYRSPFYPFDFSFWGLSPALFIFWMPVLFRFTCYYWRRTYYRVYFQDPAACAVPESKKNYLGENSFPFILQNMHRYFVILAMILLTLHWKGTLSSFFYQGHFGVGVGNLILLVDSSFLTIYVFSCHALRHLMAGRLKRFGCSQCSRTQYRVWTVMSMFNEHHGVWAWISLFSIIVSDMYVRLLSWGMIKDLNTWKIF
ncbi:MAG: succinate dehydrogenase [Candidatus Omnitrophica bacterium]|nr:succinate dehydrogenase [Candidatus Omnitrophota bacterium]